MTLADIIVSLSDADGPSGSEGAVGEAVAALLAPLADTVQTDILGNVIAVRRCGKPNAKKLMFDAHMDEIGLVITGVEDGFLRFQALGGVDARMLPAAEIKILTDEPIIGIVAAAPPHILKADEMDKTIKTEDLYIDIGMTTEQAQKAVPIGTPAVYRTRARRFGNGLVTGKALDDRAGVACMIRALELLKDTPLNVDVYVLASAQEEVGTRGAETGAFSVAPDWCIVIDTDHAKSPDHAKPDAKTLGAGVVISKGPNMNKAFTQQIIHAADASGIPYQIGVEPGDSGTNARVIQISRGGVASALVGMPLRYMHTPVELINLEDAENTALLLAEAAKTLGGGDGHA